MAPSDKTYIPDLVSTAEAAEILGQTRANVVLLIHQGTLPAVRVGTVWVILRSAVVKLVVERSTLKRGVRVLCNPPDWDVEGEVVASSPDTLQVRITRSGTDLHGWVVGRSVPVARDEVRVAT